MQRPGLKDQEEKLDEILGIITLEFTMTDLCVRNVQ